MKLSKLNYKDIQPDAGWDVLDSTKIQSYLRCPRMFFFEHVLGWRTESEHLAFGSASHLAYEHLWLNKDRIETEVCQFLDPLFLATDFNRDEVKEKVFTLSEPLKESYDIYLTEWRKFCPEEDDDLYAPKTPWRAFLALCLYQDNVVTCGYDVLESENGKLTEIGGQLSTGITTSQGFDLKIAYKMDAVLTKDDLIYGCEHKTGKEWHAWEQQWNRSIQIGTYTTVLNTVFGERFAGIIVDASLYNGTKDNNSWDKKNGLLRHVRQVFLLTDYDKVQRMRWINTINHVGHMLSNDFKTLAEMRQTDALMPAFPTNDTQCNHMFGRRCPFYTMCGITNNPLSIINSMPVGFKREVWNPLNEPVKHKMDVEGGDE